MKYDPEVYEALAEKARRLSPLEMADYLDSCSNNEDDVYQITATMLRKQDELIDSQYKLIETQGNITRELMERLAELESSQEPVGVVCEFEGIRVGTLFEQLPDGTKLYTEPQYRELSDEVQQWKDLYLKTEKRNVELQQKITELLKKASEE